MATYRTTGNRTNAVIACEWCNKHLCSLSPRAMDLLPPGRSTGITYAEAKNWWPPAMFHDREVILLFRHDQDCPAQHNHP